MSETAVRSPEHVGGPAGRHSRPRRSPVIRLLVVGMVLAGAACAIGVGSLLVDGAQVDAAQHGAARRLESTWTRSDDSSGASTATKAIPSSGSSFGLLYVPRFGTDYVRVISQGTGSTVLDRGDLGHYTTSAMPGAVGNFAIAGHREAAGGTLLHIVDLQPGDHIYVATRTTWYVYTVTGSAQVDPTDVAGIAPVPNHPGATPTKRLITLQSCTPPLIDTYRYLVWGELTATRPVSDGAPTMTVS